MARLGTDVAIWRDPRIVRFLAVGGMNTAVSYGVYALGLRVGLSFPVASAVALVFGIVFSFSTQGKLVFGSTLGGRFPRFVAVWAVIYLVNVVVIWLLMMAGLSAYLSGFLAIPVTAVLSFVLQRRFVFEPDR